MKGERQHYPAWFVFGFFAGLGLLAMFLDYIGEPSIDTPRSLYSLAATMVRRVGSYWFLIGVVLAIWNALADIGESLKKDQGR